MGSNASLYNCHIQLIPQLRHLGSDEGMTHLDKLRQVYMLATLYTRKAHSKQNIDINMMTYHNIKLET